VADHHMAWIVLVAIIVGAVLGLTIAALIT
jgi:hypothetical protein